MDDLDRDVKLYLKGWHDCYNIFKEAIEREAIKKSEKVGEFYNDQIRLYNKVFKHFPINFNLNNEEGAE